MPMGLGQLFQTVFNWSLAIVRFMMNKSMDQKPEVNIVIRFILSSKEFSKQKIQRRPSSCLVSFKLV